jgi:type IV pilus assembly protein PilN
MRLNINLASQPYEDARQFWMRWGTGLAIATILSLALVTTTISGWFAARRDHADIAKLKTEIAQRDRARLQAEEFLNRPENRSTRDQSQFLNQLIERKAFSWTHVLEDLEKVMPARVHLVSIAPGLGDDNQLHLKLSVGGDSRDKALELARRMEDSRRFNSSQITSERWNPQPNGQGDPFQCTIEAIYIPETEPVPSTRPANGASANAPSAKATSTATELSERTNP